MKSKLFYLLISCALLFSGCAKEGCMDPDSVNYDPNAKKDDYSCRYEGSVVFWYGKDVAEILVDYNVKSLTYYVDGALVGSQAANVYWSGGSPSCGAQGVITVEEDLGKSTSQSYSYEVVSDDGTTIWDGVVNFNANTCRSLELY